MKPFYITDKHPKLKKYLDKNPEILYRLFSNIISGRPIAFGFSTDNLLLQEYLEDLYIPMLLDVEAIRIDENSPNGYSSSFNGLVNAGCSDFASSVGNVAANVNKIVANLREVDGPKNALGAYVVGNEPVEFLQELQSELRQIFDKLVSRKSIHSSEGGARYELGIVFHRKLE